MCIRDRFTCSDVTTDYILVMDSPGDSNALVAVAKGRGQMENVSRGYPGEIERIVSYKMCIRDRAF